MTESERRAIADLFLRLRPLNRLLLAAGDRASRPLAGSSAHGGHGVSLGEVVGRLAAPDGLPPWSPRLRTAPSPEELEQEEALRAEGPLPLDVLGERLRLTDFEQEALLLCAAVELDSAYERLYGYVLDDLGRGAPCVELLCSLSAIHAAEHQARRSQLEPHARLVRMGLVRLGPESSSEWRREVRLTAEALSFLRGASADVDSFRDPDEVMLAPSDGAPRPWGVDERALVHAARALAGEAAVAVGVFGPRDSSQAEVPPALAVRAGRSLRRLGWSAMLSDPGALGRSARLAARLGALLWLSSDGSSAEPGAEERALRALDDLVGGPSLILSGRRPLRPLGLMARRPWLELPARSPALGEVEARWAVELPEVDEATRADLALRYRLSPTELHGAVGVFRAGRGEGALDPLPRLEGACRTVTRRRTEQFATIVAPARTPEDLVLPEALHRSVLDVARFARAWPHVAERWAMASLHRGGRGVRALFTGPSGTGKTLAAEVIASSLGQELHKVDLAGLVSKWVGETEKNLDAAFQEAEQSQAVLFFDEADALFAKRGEVKHGMDRYANLEVSFLLQRLEDHAGVVILASNLKENLDEAFSRRFHVVVEFPRPSEPERRKLWALAFPPQVPREGVDEAVLAQVDMTGAAIMNAARTAALLAASNGQIVTPAHVIEGIAREFKRESRILLPTDLAGLRQRAGR